MPQPQSGYRDDVSAIEENDRVTHPQLDLGEPAVLAAGMMVYAADGSEIGTVASVGGEELTLEAAGGGNAPQSVPKSMVAGVGTRGIQLANRGDATFGEGTSV
jgi:hypothetical protein